MENERGGHAPASFNSIAQPRLAQRCRYNSTANRGGTVILFAYRSVASFPNGWALLTPTMASMTVSLSLKESMVSSMPIPEIGLSLVSISRRYLKFFFICSSDDPPPNRLIMSLEADGPSFLL